ncbi:helix-turn-helix transcriptional regulator [Epilithonimonas sp.]
MEVSYHTITTHRRNIFEKTNCTKISELIKKALECGLI